MEKKIKTLRGEFSSQGSLPSSLQEPAIALSLILDPGLCKLLSRPLPNLFSDLSIVSNMMLKKSCGSQSPFETPCYGGDEQMTRGISTPKGFQSRELY